MSIIEREIFLGEYSNNGLISKMAKKVNEMPLSDRGILMLIEDIKETRRKREQSNILKDGKDTNQ